MTETKFETMPDIHILLFTYIQLYYLETTYLCEDIRKYAGISYLSHILVKKSANTNLQMCRYSFHINKNRVEKYDISAFLN